MFYFSRVLSTCETTGTGSGSGRFVRAGGGRVCRLSGCGIVEFFDFLFCFAASFRVV